MFILQCPTTVPPQFRGKRRLSCSHSYTPPFLTTIKGEGGLPLAGAGWSLWSRTGRSVSDFSLPRERSTTTKYSSQPTLLLAETWELPSLSRLACNPYYKHSGCKIIQCPRTPPLLDVRPRAGTRINRALLCCLLHHHLGWGNTRNLLVGIRTPGSGHRQASQKSVSRFGVPISQHIVFTEQLNGLARCLNSLF